MSKIKEGMKWRGYEIHDFSEGDEEPMWGVCDLLVDGHHGIYVPQLFVQLVGHNAWGLRMMAEEVKILQEGPDHKYYWEAWDKVTENELHKDMKGAEWSLRQQDDGDLFAVHRLTDEELTGKETSNE